ncbi:maltokinase [Singulisphaera sp. GP187]|uniref:maltose alpha-D-glucosyltransferase n=1 Tax=Singulisphaera sp. GP187 TaxID=1882752 RepID=UPI00092C7FE9|nr:maltose alpha-D-glucosyltransferase [Singulisphaera sp. GP187]SIN92643.1 maltokinase [Singulisphaera sp. GP187]
MAESDPLWYKDAIIYELHVKAFFDSNENGLGDFAGLMQKLDYLQDLGVTCLWLLPFYPSPLRDDGYDIADYFSVHPEYGTVKDFRQLVREAHRRGIRVVTELVINHTSDQHPWFQEARNAPPGSAKRNFYVWSDSPKKYAAARIIFTDTETSNWTWDPVAKAYYWHRFFHHQPDLNFDNPQVLRAVFKVMRFWLDMGVDGMRLDAIPYLIEREGTNCENLPESHDILKKFRKEMDEHYSDRMLLAEANQWPADVLDYFGDGDECHMAFHFPLMPRIFMALRQEDRHPIVEIMRQTPDIPPDCQWVTFLRNHDELTLEMVTDDERDYMYREYAADPRMRLNLGIRRRLAPLMGNNRRSIELMNSLLFSLVGTPVIYYGDEIGMGDNIYLGDRDGVRTPMQWTGDRNAGFSRADFARLYAPPIIDPVFGYQSINVEAQQREASSLLNWMKRLITLRKRFQAFGRGTLEFLHPRNRQVLAYIRSYGDEQILAVANVSRFVQPFSLDLERFQGYTPVELFGGVEFPTIGEAPYFLSLGPYAFMWFRLDRLTHSIDRGVVRAPALAAEALPSLTLAGGWDTLMEGKARATLERTVLPNYLLRQRWFGAKSRTLETVSIRDWVTVSGATSPALLVFIRAYYSDGHSDKYSVPLAIAEGVAAESLLLNQPAMALAFVAAGDLAGVLYDAVANDEFCERLLQTIEGPSTIKTRSGMIQGIRTSAFDQIEGAPTPLQRGSAEQSNSTVFYGRRFLMKLFRRLDSGVNPDLEIGRFLTEKAEFPRIPKTTGALEYRASRAEPITIALLQEYVSNQGQGWQLALDVLGRYYEHVSTQEHRLFKIEIDHRSVLELGSMEPPPVVFEVVGAALNTAGVLGKRTAEMHLALASDGEDPNFAPEPLEQDELAEMVKSLQVQVRMSLTLLREKLDSLPASLQPLAHEILDTGAGIAARFKPLAEGVGPLVKIRCHGDYHLGQVLWHENDFIILDFEGEPGRPVTERRAKKSPLRDVAGMLRSLDYAVYSKLISVSRDQPESFDRLEPWAKVWKNWTSAAYLREYRVTAASLLPDDEALMSLLLEFFMLEKTLFEFQYELNYRPDWVRIPMLGILHLMKPGG